MSSETYQGAEGWAGPVDVTYREGRPIAATCTVCGNRWPLQVLTSSEHGRVLGPLICPNGCGTDDQVATDPRI